MNYRIFFMCLWFGAFCCLHCNHSETNLAEDNAGDTGEENEINDDDGDDDDDDNDNDNNDNDNDDNDNDDNDNDNDDDDDNDDDTSTNDTVDCIDLDQDWWCETHDCDDNNPLVNPDQSEITNNGIDDDCDGEIDGLPTDTDSNDEVCDEQDFAIEPKPISMMILQDRSGSMDTNKWSQALDASSWMLETFRDSKIEFGYDVFPDGIEGDGCVTSNPVQVDCHPDASDDIIAKQAEIPEPRYGKDMTPLYTGLKNFTNVDYAPGLINAPHNKYIVVVSDGGDTCGTNGQNDGIPWADAAQLQSVTESLLKMDIQSIVIGFNYNGNTDLLNAIASSGGTPFTEYIEANDQPALEQAFQTIASTVVSCVFEITDPSSNADINMINFYIDDEVVPYDEDCQNGTGWTWTSDEHNAIEFCEASCALLRDGNNHEIQATFGCETIIVKAD